MTSRTAPAPVRSRRVGGDWAAAGSGGAFRTPAPLPPRSDVLGVGVSALTMRDTLAILDGFIETRTRTYVCVTGVHGVMECQQDAELLRIHNEAGLVTPDGMPLVWLSRRRGHAATERVYGPDLMLAACRRSLDTGHRHFFYGGAEGVPELLAKNLARRFPGLQVCGTYSPPFRPLTGPEEAAVADRINAVRPDIVWVGLSTPKQERWMASQRPRLEAPVLIGVGAAFDFHAGLKPQAPRWMQRSGLEWLYRMLSEPKRLGPRYLVNNPRFIGCLVGEMAGLRRTRTSGSSA